MVSSICWIWDSTISSAQLWCQSLIYCGQIHRTFQLHNHWKEQWNDYRIELIFYSEHKNISKQWLDNHTKGWLYSEHRNISQHNGSKMCSGIYKGQKRSTQPDCKYDEWKMMRYARSIQYDTIQYIEWTMMGCKRDQCILWIQREAVRNGGGGGITKMHHSIQL